MRKVYLDNGSTSYPKAPGVGEAMSDFIIHVGCNVGRGGYETAYQMGEVIYETRQQLCELFHFPEPKNVVFTPSVTYSLNYVIRGFLKPGDHVIMSSMEHNAVARPVKAMEAAGCAVSIAPCTPEGQIIPEELEKCFRENTKLVVTTHASNVCGTILDVETMSRICHERNVPYVIDSAQSAGIIPIDFTKLGLAALCVTGHKGLLGPQGIGAMLLTDEMAQAMDPVILGGTGSASHLLTMPDFMPDKFEAGTLNLPGIVGLHAALKYLKETGIEKIRELENARVDQFIGGVTKIPGVRVIGLPTSEGRVPVVSLDFQGIDNADVSFLLDSDYGIMTRCALHCAPLAHQTLGTFPEGTVRFAFGHTTTEEEVEYAVRAISDIMGDGSAASRE